MVNILLKDFVGLYRYGLTCFFSELFHQEFGDTTRFSFEVTPDSIMRSDVIVLSLCQGESLLHLPEFQIKQQVVLLGFVDDESRISASSAYGVYFAKSLTERVTPENMPSLAKKSVNGLLYT